MAGRFRILVLCTANMCRSPLAEQVLRRELAAGNVDADVSSAGTHAEPGDPMCQGAAAWLQAAPGDHCARQLDAAMLADADIVLTADRGHRAFAARLAPACRPRLFTLRQAAALATRVSGQVAEGQMPEGAPPLPVESDARLRWFVAEMDAARGTGPQGEPDDDDIVDRHGPEDHRETFEQVGEAAVAVAAGLATVGTADRHRP